MPTEMAAPTMASAALGHRNVSWRHQNTSAYHRRGYCGLTISAGECTIGDSGTLEASQSLSACRHACLSCARCTTISYSSINRDCSWYAYCDVRDLRRPPKNAPDYVSVRVRARPAPPALRWPRKLVSSFKLKIGVATTSAPTLHSACALRQWCERAGLFARALRALGWSVSVLVLSEPGQRLDDCAEGELAPIDPRLLQLVSRCQAVSVKQR